MGSMAAGRKTGGQCLFLPPPRVSPQSLFTQQLRAARAARVNVLLRRALTLQQMPKIKAAYLTFSTLHSSFQPHQVKRLGGCIVFIITE